MGLTILWDFPRKLHINHVHPAWRTDRDRLLLPFSDVGDMEVWSCTAVLVPSEITSLSVLRLCDLVKEVGFSPDAVIIINGYGSVAGKAISEHMGTNKVWFIGIPVTGRLMAKGRPVVGSSLKTAAFELGRKGPNIILDDADFESGV